SWKMSVRNKCEICKGRIESNEKKRFLSYAPTQSRCTLYARQFNLELNFDNLICKKCDVSLKNDCFRFIPKKHGIIWSKRSRSGGHSEQVSLVSFPKNFLGDDNIVESIEAGPSIQES